MLVSIGVCACIVLCVHACEHRCVHVRVSIVVCTCALYVRVCACTCLLVLFLRDGRPSHVRKELAQIPLNYALTHTIHMHLASYFLDPTYKVFVREGPGPKRI